MKKPALLFALAALAAGSALAAPPASVLKAEMPAHTFHAAGLDKLSPQQLKVLEDWVRAHPLPPAAPSMGEADLQHTPKPPPEPKRMSSRVVGHFDGWRHGSIITLANGQQWEVIDDSELVAPNAGHPVATVRRAFLGSHLLTVQGYNIAARVRRVH